MGIPSKQIGWKTEENLLWQISKQLEYLTKVTYNSKYTLLNVEDPYYNNPDVRAKIETFSGAFSGTFLNEVSDPFLIIDLNKTSGCIIDYSFITLEDGDSETGTYMITSSLGTALGTTAGSVSINTGNGISVQNIQDGNLVKVFLSSGNNLFTSPFEILYTVKLFTLPMYNN